MNHGYQSVDMEMEAFTKESLPVLATVAQEKTISKPTFQKTSTFLGLAIFLFAFISLVALQRSYMLQTAAPYTCGDCNFEVRTFLYPRRTSRTSSSFYVTLAYFFFTSCSNALLHLVQAMRLTYATPGPLPTVVQLTLPTGLLPPYAALAAL